MKKFIKKRFSAIDRTDFIKQITNIILSVERQWKDNTSFEVKLYTAAPLRSSFVLEDGRQEFIDDFNKSLIVDQFQGNTDITEESFNKARYIEAIIKSTKKNSVSFSLITLDKDNQQYLQWYIQNGGDDNELEAIADSVKKKLNWLYTIK